MGREAKRKFNFMNYKERVKFLKQIAENSDDSDGESDIEDS